MVSDEGDRPVPPEFQDALYVLGEYLSDKVAPLMALDALTLLMELPPAFVAREVATGPCDRSRSSRARWRSATCSSTPRARST